MMTDKSDLKSSSAQTGHWVLTEGKTKKGGLRKVIPSPRPKVPPQGKPATKAKHRHDLAANISKENSDG